MMKELFMKRLSALYNSWNFLKQELWGNSDIVVIHSQSETSSNLQSTQFYLWLFGEEFHDTTAIFGPCGIYFFSTQKNFTKIRSLCASATLIQKIPVSVQLKSKNDDGFLLIDGTIRNARVIRNKNVIFDDEKDCPFVVGYVEGEYPKTKLFWSCINDLEPKKYKAVTVNSGLDKLLNTADKKPSSGVGLLNEKGVSKSASPKLDEGESSKLMGRVKENTLACSTNDENVWLLLENLELTASRLSGKQNMLRVPKVYGDEPLRFGGDWYGKKEISKKRNKDGDQLFKFGASRSDGNEDKSKEGNKSGDQLFKFGETRVDVKEDNAKEVNENGDLLFKFHSNRLNGKEDKSEEGKKDGDQLFKFGGKLPDAKEDQSKEGTKCDDQLFKFGEVKKEGDQLFKFGGNLLDAKEGKSKEGIKDGDQLFKLGEKKKDHEEKEGSEHVKLLKERLTTFYSNWRNYEEELWGKADVLVITTQSVGPCENLPRSMSSSFLVWLLDQEFPDTTAVFTRTGIEFLCTKESFSSLRTIGIRITKAAKVPVSVQLKKGGEHCLDWVTKTLCQMSTSQKSGPNQCQLVVGFIKGESVETEALSHSKMFEVAYVDNGLTNLLGLGNCEKSETFVAGQQPTLPKCFQKLPLSTCSSAKTANAVSLSELAKIKSMYDNAYLFHTTSKEEKSLLEKKGVASSPLLTGTSVDNKGLGGKKVCDPGNLPSKLEEAEMFKVSNLPRGLEEKKTFEEDNLPTKLEENGIFEDNLSRELAEKMTLHDKNEGDTETTSPNTQKNQQHTPHIPSSQAQPNSASQLNSNHFLQFVPMEPMQHHHHTSIIEDGAKEKPLADEQNTLCDPENSNLLQLKECGEQSSLTAEGRMEDSVQKVERVIGVTDDATSENCVPDDLKNSSSRKESAVSDGEDGEWTLIESEPEQQETEVAEKVSWKRWFMDKTANSFGLKDKVSDEASSK